MKDFKFNFIKHSQFLLKLSTALTVLGIFCILTKGFVLGIDFAGGNEIQIKFEEVVPEISKIRSFLKEGQGLDATIQSFEEDRQVLIRTQQMEAQKITEISQKMKQHFKGSIIERVDFVGPQIGQELRQKGLLAILYSLILILIYVGLRFDYRYAPSAVFCLFHDAILTMAIFSLFERQVNVQTLASILAIIGYSLNDTIVTFDRIRENVSLFSKKESFVDICNRSINDVLSRTLITSFTTLLAVASMWFLTKGVIKDFAFTLGIGVVIGTYSSIYVATPLVVLFHKIKI